MHWTRDTSSLNISGKLANRFASTQQLDELQAQLAQDCEQNDGGLRGLRQSALAVEFVTREARWRPAASMLLRPTAAAARACLWGFQAAGAHLGLCPVPLPGDALALQRALWAPGGYASEQLRMQRHSGVARLVQQRREQVGCARLIVGGIGPHFNLVPRSLLQWLEKPKLRRPEDVTLNLDALEGPDIWGSISSRRTTDLFDDASFDEVLFEYIDWEVFANQTNRSLQDCLDRCEQTMLSGLREHQWALSCFNAPSNGADTLPEAVRILGGGGCLSVLGWSNTPAYQPFWDAVALLPLRLDVVVSDNQPDVDAVLARAMGTPWVAVHPHTWLLLFTKV